MMCHKSAKPSQKQILLRQTETSQSSNPGTLNQRKGGDLSDAGKYVHGIYQVKNPHSTMAAYSWDTG